jgi:hypothetical protein
VEWGHFSAFQTQRLCFANEVNVSPAFACELHIAYVAHVDEDIVLNFDQARERHNNLLASNSTAELLRVLENRE